MTKSALIDPLNRVVQIEKVEDIFEVALPFEWVSCGEEVVVGMLYKEGNFVEDVDNVD